MLRQDLLFAARMLRRSPAFTLVAIISLALGIGVNISIFTFINAILLRPLPVPDPGQLVSIYHQSPQVGLSSSSYPDFEFYRTHSDVFSGMLAYLRVPMLLRAREGSQKLSGELVSQDYFQVLGLRPALGRWFLPGETAAAVMSHGLWQRSFAGDPRVLGAQLPIGAGVFTVVGIAPADFRGLVLDWGKPPDVWIPVTAFREAVPAFGEVDVMHRWGMHSFLVAGRLRPGVSIDTAQAQLSVLSARAAPQRAEAFRAQWQFTPQVFPAQRARFWPTYRDSIVRVLVMLATAVGMVLLLACFNVANLMLVRATARQKEIAVRLSLGAGRGRLLRQLLTESLLISMLGGATGLLVAYWTTAYLATFHNPFKIPLSLHTGFDGRVFGFALALSAFTGLLFGLAPARQAWRLSLTAALKADGAGAGRGGHGLRSVLVIAQVAISAVLLLGAGLFLRTLLNAQATDVTADPGNILVTNIELAGQGYDAARSRAFYPQLLDRVRALPGVRGAALVFVVPMSGRRGGNDIVLEGRRIQVDFNVISSGYFATLGLPVLRGREFSDGDREGTEAVAVINEEMAKRFWPGENALGKRIEVVSGKGRIVQIVGVVRDGKFRNYRDTLRPCLYVSLAQEPRREMNLEVRTAGDPIRMAPAIREAIRQIDRSLIAPEVLTLKSQRDLGLSQERLIVSLLAGLAALALVLAAVGIYGVVSFAVAQRRREIGIRIALGARRADVLRIVLRQGLALVIAGLAIGMGAALALGRLIAGLLFGVGATDAATLTATEAVLLVVATAASYLPARRAAAVDPAIALRQE